MSHVTQVPSLGTTVLVVEDEDLVRMVVRDMLEGIGLEVLEAADGEDGLSVLRADPAIRLVITDVSMPRMNGITMVAKAREFRSDLLVLLMSGQTAPPVGEQFIHKPYRMADLQEKVVAMMKR